MNKKVAVATIQFKPWVGDIVSNRACLLALMGQATGLGAKMIVLPEMSTSGYLWPNKYSLEEFAEVSTGETFDQFSAFCVKNSCYLAYGYPQIEAGKLYNAQNLISPKGQLITTYRKVHLFEADLFWASPGKNPFKSIETEFGKIGLGICMDLNFDDFIQFHKENETKWLLFSTNWLEEENAIHKYWIDRLKGFNGVFCASNTFGSEYKVQFCGESCVIENGIIARSADKFGNQVLITEHLLD